jgi:hypothetical protein
MIGDLKRMAAERVGEWLTARSLRRHRSNIGWRLAGRYTSYLERCRREVPMPLPRDASITRAVAAFERDGVTSLHWPGSAEAAALISRRIAELEASGTASWDAVDEFGDRGWQGDVWLDFPELEELFAAQLGAFLTGYFRAPFKLLYGKLYRSTHANAQRSGSQLWHSDSGPGICINVMFYLHATTPRHGALEVLPWPHSLPLLQGRRSAIRSGAFAAPGRSGREQVDAYYGDRIAGRHAGDLVQPTGPAGLIVPFLNNTLHRGGYPEPGEERTAMVFHCYPSHLPLDLARYRTKGLRKTVGYPQDPAMEF